MPYIISQKKGRKNEIIVLVLLLLFSFLIFFHPSSIQGFFIIIGKASQIVQGFFIVDSTSPFYTNVSQGDSTVFQGYPIELSSYWYDNIKLQYAWLETNENGSWVVNNVLSLNTNESWGNFTWQNSLVPAGTIVGWRIYANDTTGNQNSTEINTFQILAVPVVTTTTTPGGGAGLGGGGGGGPSGTGESNLVISYKEEINLTRGYPTPILIELKNTGTFNLHNLTLVAKSVSIIVENITPNKIDVLEPEESAVFSALVLAPQDLELGKYDLDLVAISEEIEKTIRITANVEISSLYETNKQLLDQYSWIIGKLENKTSELSKFRNTTEAERILSELKLEYGVSKELFDLGLYDKSIENLEKVKAKVVELVNLLARLKSSEVTKVGIKAVSWNSVVVIFGLILLIVILFLIYLRIKPRRKHYSKIRTIRNK